MDLTGFEKNLKYLPLRDLRIDDPFWNGCVRLVTSEILPYQYNTLWDRIPGAPPSRCIRNLRIAAGLEEGAFEGWVFQDTDLAKWLEAAAYSLASLPDAKLREMAEEMIDLVLLAQQPNGYLNSYFTILHPGHQFCNLKEGHELYTAGHFIEAAVAWYQVTGEDRFLCAMRRFADLICEVFHTPEYADAVPGHEEIELALYRLYEATGEERYRAMAYDFINRRGTTDYLSRESSLPRFVDVWHDPNPYVPEYGQAHAPVREQTTAEGHAVRALYLYSAMADLAGSYEDAGLLAACERLYENITQKRMYITGGIGSSGVMERFTTDYDLPNDSAYAESCASIALAMFCKRMARITGEAKYMDTAELAIYNTVLAGIAMDGRSFFYVNPLEVIPEACMPATDRAHVKPVRQKWFGCACCPPNIARTLASLGEYVLLRGDGSIRVNLLISGVYRTEISGVPVEIAIESSLPWEGHADIRVRAERPVHGSLLVRIPEYAEDPVFTGDGGAFSPRMDRGYAVIPVNGIDTRVGFDFGMTARLIYANPRVSADSGKVAVRKGPLVYCLEEADNGEGLAALRIDISKPMKEVPGGELRDCVTVEAEGLRLQWSGELYSTRAPDAVPVKLRFVPYCFWGNREPGEMTVWVTVK